MTRLEQKPAGYTVRRLLAPLQPLQYIAWLLFGVSGGVLVLIDVWSLRLITRHLTSGSEQLQPILQIILIYCGTAALLKIIQSQSERRSYASFNHHRMSFMARLLCQYMIMDFPLYEDQSFLDEAESAFRAVQNNQEGVEGMYHRMFGLLADLTALLLLSGLLWAVSPLIVIALLVYIAVSVGMMRVVSSYRFRRREQLSESRRRNAVYGSQASDFSYGKDTRLFSAGPRLLRYYQQEINRLPQGMDRVLLKIVDPQGLVLSGGENQKLLIARALYRQEARILIMDEPTASLDALAEEKIYQEMNQNMAGKTGLFISHRLASTRFCDEILLLDGGRIAERGTHDRLMAENGAYAHMFRTQGRYYQEAGDEEA